VLLAALGAAAVSVAAPVWAEPSAGQVLTDLAIGGSDGCVDVRVTFSLPFRMIKHFPEDVGQEIRVQVDPFEVSGTDPKALKGREAIRPGEFDDRVPLDEVLYEGDIEGGPFVTFRFTRAVTFHLDQGDDFRSLRLYLPGPQRDGPCPADPTR